MRQQSEDVMLQATNLLLQLAKLQSRPHGARWLQQVPSGPAAWLLPRSKARGSSRRLVQVQRSLAAQQPSRCHLRPLRLQARRTVQQQS